MRTCDASGEDLSGIADRNGISFSPAAGLDAPESDDWWDNTIVVPMGGRTYAACIGKADYE